MISGRSYAYTGTSDHFTAVEVQQFRIIGRMLPAEVFTPTEAISPEGQSYFEVTTAGRTSEVEKYVQKPELEAVYEALGLSWKQIGELFGVSTRAVHFWVTGENKLATKNRELLNQLTKVISQLSDLRVFQRGRLFEKHILSKPHVIRRLQKGDYSPLTELAQSRDHHVAAETWPLSTEALRERISSNPYDLMSSLNDEEAMTKPGKMKTARIAQRRKSS